MPPEPRGGGKSLPLPPPGRQWDPTASGPCEEQAAYWVTPSQEEKTS